MQRHERISIALLFGCAAMFSMGCRANRASDANTKRADQQPALVHAAATVVSVEERAHDEQSYDLLPGPRVCFTIDSFDEIAETERSAYESAERVRQAAHGPRCRDTSIDPAVVRIKAGDSIDVYFKLENAGLISVVRVKAGGVDL